MKHAFDLSYLFPKIMKSFKHLFIYQLKEKACSFYFYSNQRSINRVVCNTYKIETEYFNSRFEIISVSDRKLLCNILFQKCTYSRSNEEINISLCPCCTSWNGIELDISTL